MAAPAIQISCETIVTHVFMQTSWSSQQIFRWHKRSHRLDFHLPSSPTQSHEKLAANTDRQETILSQEQPLSCRQTESCGHAASWQTKLRYSAACNKEAVRLKLNSLRVQPTGLNAQGLSWQIHRWHVVDRRNASYDG